MGATRYDRRMYAIMNKREGAVLYATAARRRTVIGVHVLLTLAAVATWLGMLLEDALWPALVMLGLLPPWVLTTGIINGSTRGLLELRGRMLDERQLVERDRVRSLAHRITTGVLVAAAAGTGCAVWLADVRFEGMLFPALFAVLVLHWLMPLWVAGLRVQDECLEDSAE
ncbi:hypothetical protein [Streptomyces sp. SP18CS02]|uniref:hypothetical protein n=1 Tax=Streptomyces sp. SP18CS02 TaxID=3002531 RepID=UPI002E78E80B|nr:hypothetical protein [Streptomyces sp. SP18CS02]MEE1756131.1 hypothetical protein [Streptomyces sp. SP18CS02]